MKNSRWQIVCLNDKTRREARESVSRKNFYRMACACVRDRENRLECSKTGCTEILLPYLIPLSLMRCQDFSTNTKMKEKILAREKERVCV
ncbi:hypothetical protein ALC57_05897 [Trachymyrmex cornetzi]|uniref:Uncharacterized protein n=1 Tax=Trachymyrmex cornetzi TaxID=471704 RepID=A0A151J9F2_9HYME|nr:hypothetical protein ALC57_05897 [Trachymyrmex cornetzi]